MATYSITGIVVSAKRQQPLPGLRVEAWDKDMVIDDLLGTATTDARGIFVLQFDQRYYQELVFDRKPDIYFKVYSGDRLVLDTSATFLRNISTKPDPILLTVPDEALDTPSASSTFAVSGFVTTAKGRPLANITVTAYDKGIDGLTAIGTATTDEAGKFTIRYDKAALGGKSKADLLVRVFADAAQTQERARSEVRYGAGAAETINFVIADSQNLRGTEYERLLAALTPHLGGKQMKDLKEEGDSQNITYLAYKSGWDPRMVAMAARAASLSAETGIAAPHYYALFRSGLPNDLATLHSLSVSALANTLEMAVTSGIIPRDKKVDETLRLHAAASAAYALDSPVSGSISSLGAMLDLRLNSQQKTLFMEAYEDTKAEPEALWTTLAGKGFSFETISALQDDAKLGFITQQNAPLITHLRQEFEVNKPEELARHGLYTTEAWLPVVGNMVPSGNDAELYATGLAMQVSLNYPTHVTADLMRRGALDADTDTGLSGAADFLENGAIEYEIGMQPVKTWEGFTSLDTRTQSNLKQVERLYQMSPSNAAMIAMAKAGLDSAYKIMSYTQGEFMAKFGKDFPSETEAMMAYHKAGQVYSTSLIYATQYFTQSTSPNVYAIHGGFGLRDQGPVFSDAPAIVVPPSLENLFGSIDYCACTHCRSVLSPAAYLVELLQFIDLENVPHTLSNPVTVLLGRRPDIQYILLSCENTNTAMPYIDLVNEVLEFYIVHNGSLANFEGYNTAEGTTTADLLADPQFVEETAYDPPHDNVYPLSLPFDRPLENLRLIVESFDTSLAEASRVFQTPLLARRELLGLNQMEYDILVGAAGRTVPEYYGRPSNATITALNTAVANAKVYSRTTDLTYTELVNLLKTRFINPGVDLVPLLEALRLTMEQLGDYYAENLSGPDLVALLPPDLDLSPYTPDVPQWLTANENLILTLITLTDQNPEDTACDFGNMELRFANPDTANNRLDMLAYDRLHRFIRLWRKLGWSMELTDAVVIALLPMNAGDITAANIDATFVTLLARIANLRHLITLQKISLKKLPAWLALWDTTIPIAQRREVLAKFLKAGVTDLDELITITGFDPLANDMEADQPSLLNLVAAWKLLKAAGPKVIDVDYVLRNWDLTGQLTLSDAVLTTQIKLLRDSMTSVEASLSALPANPDLEFARTKMALVYDGAVVTDFMGLVGNTTTYTAPFVLDVDSLPAAVAAADARLGYDAFKNLLTYSGQMSAAAQAALNAAAVGQITNIAAFNTAVQALRTAGTEDYDLLNTHFPELGTLYTALQALATDAEKAQAILAAILPALKDVLKDNALRMALVAILKVDQPTVEVLTGNADVLHAANNVNLPVLSDFRALENTVAMNANGTYQFYVEAPATDDFILYLRALNGTTVSLSVNGAPPVIANQTITAPQPTDEAEVKSVGQLSWTTGDLMLIQVDVANLPVNGSVTLSWRTNGMAKALVPASKIYTTTAVSEGKTSLIRLQKAAMVQSLLKLTAMELGYFAATNADTQGILNALVATGLVSGLALTAQWTKFALLLQFVLLKKENEPEQNTWVKLLQNPSLATPAGQSILLSVNGWTQANLDAVLLQFGYTQASLSSLVRLYRVREAMALVGKTYYAAADLRLWFVGNPDYALIQSIKANMQTILDETAWLETMQSISDALRNRSRDAMVAYILHHLPPSPGIQNADQLYEYFLIDTQMDACMQTSRIRMALSSVQLFIMRCMMNLEPQVSPDSIRKHQWEWMKRYRVWEANRKIFLFPENWLEPELRDNKSPFFKELEGELMKSDITDELAEDAYLHYLKKLDDVSTLEVVGTYLQEGEAANTNDDILHVFGRTNGNSRQYYYRRYEPSGWTAWEKVSLQIEGDIVFPIIWKRKLFVFWLTVLAKPASPVGGTTYDVANAPWTDSTKKNVEVTLCWGEFYKGKWSSPKSSELKKPVYFNGLSNFDPAKFELFARTYTPPPPSPGVKLSEKLIFNLWYPGMGDATQYAKVTFTSKNSPPYIEPGTYDQDLADKVDLFTDRQFLDPYKANYPDKTGYDQNSIAWPERAFKVNVKQPKNANQSVVTHTLTTKRNSLFPGYSVRFLTHPTENQWNAPFFYKDERCQFFVQPEEDVYLVRDEPGYYFPKKPDIVLEIPELIEIPIPDILGPIWNPEVVNPQGPVINPGNVIIGENPYIFNVLPATGLFTFGNVMFGGNGQVNVGNQGFATGTTDIMNQPQ